MATPIWNEKEKRWTLRIRVNGVSHKFTSVERGEKGKRIVLKRAREYGHHGIKNPTVAEVREEWLEEVEARHGRRSETYRQAEALTRLFVLPKIGKIHIFDIKMKDWQRCINDAHSSKGDAPLSKKYLSNIRCYINLLIKYAYENEYTDPLRGELYIPAGHPTKGKEILDTEAVKRLLEPSEEWFWGAWVLMLLTGCRPGEIYGLQNGDFDGMTITIRRAINEQGIITEGKNQNARRVIPLHPFARDLLRKTIERNELLNTEWIFCRKDGRMCSPQRARESWTRFAASRNIPGTPYSLRHTFVSMVKTTMPEALVKQLVGHSAQMDTFGVYGHRTKEDEQATISYLMDVFGNG